MMKRRRLVNRLFEVIVALGVLYAMYLYLVAARPVDLPSSTATGLKGSPYNRNTLCIKRTNVQLKAMWQLNAPRRSVKTRDWAYLRVDRNSPLVQAVAIRYDHSPMEHFRSFVGALRRAIGPQMPILITVDQETPDDLVKEASQWLNVTVIHDDRWWMGMTGGHLATTTATDPLLEPLPSESDGHCRLLSTWERPPITTSTSGNKLCICVSVENNGEHPVIAQSPFFDVLLKSFLRTTTTNADGQLDFHFYIGFHNDSTYDHQPPSAFNQFTAEFRRLIGDRPIGLHAFRYPFLSPLVDRSRLYNLLMDDAYREGCDYLYQMNDDTLLLDNGWASELTNCLSKNDGLGGASMEELGSTRRVTAMIHRRHIDIFGSYWPVKYIDWDNEWWIEQVYELGSKWCQWGKMRSLGDVHSEQKHCTTEIDMAMDVQRAREQILSHVVDP